MYLEESSNASAAFGEYASGNNCLPVTVGDASLFISKVWPHLPPHVREAILTLVDAALKYGDRAEPELRSLPSPQ
jgi:hypothetical protein